MTDETSAGTNWKYTQFSSHNGNVASRSKMRMWGLNLSPSNRKTHILDSLDTISIYLTFRQARIYQSWVYRLFEIGGHFLKGNFLTFCIWLVCFMGGGERERWETSRCEKPLGARNLKGDFTFWGKILQNSEDYKTSYKIQKRQHISGINKEIFHSMWEKQLIEENCRERVITVVFIFDVRFVFK